MPTDLTLRQPIFPKPQISMDDLMAQARGENALKNEIDIMKGALIGPFTLGPDMIGLIQRLQTPPAMQQYLSENPDLLFNADPIREAIDLDPQSGWGMVGEAVGGWENALAKGGTAAVKLFTAAMEHSPDVIHSMIMGATAAESFGKGAIGKMREARRMLDAGENPATVLEKTSWWRGSDGEMRFAASDLNTQFDTDYVDAWVLNNIPNDGNYKILETTLDKVIKPESPIFKAYPELKDMDIHISLLKSGENWKIYNPSVEKEAYAYFNPEYGLHGLIGLDNADTLAKARRSLLHEINHKIQRIEGFSPGTNTDDLINVGEKYHDMRRQRGFLLETLDNFSRDELATFSETEVDDLIEDYIRRRHPELANIENQNEQALRVGIEYMKYRSIIDPFAAGNAANADYVFNALKAEEGNLIRDAAVMLRLGNESIPEMIETLKGMDWPDIYYRAFKRYFSQGGEVDSRLVEFFSDMDVDTIYQNLLRETRRSGGPEELVNIKDAMDAPQQVAMIGPIRRGEISSQAPERVTHFSESLSEEDIALLQRALNEDPTLISKWLRLLEEAQDATVRTAE